MAAVRRIVLVGTLTLALAACGDGADSTTATPPETRVEITEIDESGRPVTREPGLRPVVDGRDPADQGVRSSPVRVAGTVATGLDVPWGLALLPDSSALVSQRDNAEIVRVAPDGKVTTVGKVPGVQPSGEGGLLGIAVADDFADAPMLYVYFTAANDNRIVRMEYGSDGLGTPKVLVDGIKKSGVHNGGRLAFGPDGMLYAGTGDAGVRGSSQDQKSLNGKILRMTPAGKPPADNPDPSSLVFSSGHRNVQGLAFDDRDRLWAAEFGQNAFDELNLIKAGANYGWPQVEGTGGGGRFTEPERVWSTDEASPSGIAVWEGSVWMAGLRGSRLWEIPLTGENADQPTREPKDWFSDKYGRLRTVAQAPDGSLWLITSNTDGRGDVQQGDDRILRITRR